MRVVTAAMLAATTACTAVGSRPAEHADSHALVSVASATSLPLPAATARRLPDGVFYINAGPANVAWQSLWEATGKGTDTRIVPGAAGDAVNGFAASAAGVVLTDEANNGLSDQLARLTRKGVTWLNPYDHKNRYINA